MFWNRNVAIGAVIALVLVLLVYGFWPQGTPVTVERATRDSLRVTIEEEGQTRLRERYVVSAPTTGYLRRVPGRAGDSISKGDPLAHLATLPSKVLDENDYAVANANVETARAGLRRAQNEAEGAESALQYAREEYERIQRLQEKGTASQHQLDQARMEFQKAKASHEAARQAVEQARGELKAAQRRISQSNSPESLPSRLTIRAPIDGRILTVHQKSAGVVQAGTPLFTVGNPGALDVSVDVLSSDAVRITPGTPVEIVRWGGDPLEGEVRVVPPQGQTEVSALGVEEQRVEVRVDFAEALPPDAGLGTGYRAVARFVIWEGADVLQVPQSALFRHDGGWAVFTLRDGRAHRQPVQIGRRSGLRAEITSGLESGTRVITHPGNELSDGMAVEPR